MSKINDNILISNEKNKNQKLAIPFIIFDTNTKKFSITSESRKIICKVSQSKIGMVSLV